MDVDVVIIGAGPSGIQAGIHSSRKKASTLLIGKIVNSAASGTHIENYFGFRGTVSGDDLLSNGLDQAKSFGCTHLDENVVSVAAADGRFDIISESGESIKAISVILATGISRKKLNVPGEKEFLGRGVSYCAACDCNFYRDKTVVIVGDESEAAISAELMTKYASKVYWVTAAADADRALISKATAAGVEIVKDSVSEIRGQDAVTTVLLVSGTELNADGVFIELGGRSSVDLAMDLGVMPEMDDTVKVNEKCETSAEGVFACGDITGKPWQIAKAVGQGAVAGTVAADKAKAVRR